METRPRINIELSPLDRFLEWSGNLLLFFMWCLTVYILFKLPATIPIHYNASGEVDNYGDKEIMLLLPIIGTFLFIGLSFLNRYPHIFNYMTKITAENAEGQYRIATRMLRFLKLSILLVFTHILLFTYLTAIGMAKGLGSWFLPVTLGLFFIPTAISIVKSLGAK